MVVAWLLDHARRGGAGGAVRGLSIITGRGLGSEGGVPLVKPAVEELLREMEIPFREAKNNPGRLVVDGEDARRGLVAAPSDAARCLVEAADGGSREAGGLEG